MLPLHDLNRPLRTPHVTRILIIINVSVFLATILYAWLDVDELSFMADVYDEFAMFPREIIRGERLYTVFTSMFLHGGLLHLFGNMVYLYVFGDNVEDALGHGKYLVFYLFCGVAASVVYILTLTTPQQFSYPVIGASGAISGVLGAYFVLYPRAKVLTLVFFGWIVIVPIPAIVFLGFWFLMQWMYGMVEFVSVASSGVAYWAHVGGFLAGMTTTLLFRGKILESQRKRRIRALGRGVNV
ncbi:rhomboid family intramembrane serine protease [Candidatus Bathyarchaeota archaeon]|nr:MAG: rhomboid family intramembrane serine protease [Candidatus Bathyarchaeota archaeon]